MKIAVLGACGGIGQPFTLLLKQCPLVKELALYDIARHTYGVAKDISHINTPAVVKGYLGPDRLADCLKGCDIVTIPAGVPRKPGMTRDDLFDFNASVVRSLSEAIAKSSPKAVVCIITNPVNSTVPIVAEVFKKAGIFDRKKVLGVTTLDLVRSSTFVAQLKGLDPVELSIPVVGGHSGHSIIPVFSQSKPKVELTEQEKIKLMEMIQEAGTEVVKAKAGAGSATVAMAWAGARFVIKVVKAMLGEKDVVECAFIATNRYKTNYFAVPVLLGKEGFEKNLGMPELSQFEKTKLEAGLPELKKNIQRGIDFVHKDSD